VTTIHDLAEDVSEVGPRNLCAEVLGVVQIIFQDLTTNRQIAVVEGVLLGPSLSSELDTS